MVMSRKCQIQLKGGEVRSAECGHLGAQELKDIIARGVLHLGNQDIKSLHQGPHLDWITLQSPRLKLVNIGQRLNEIRKQS